MRPSFHCATGCPCSAAYWSAVSALALSALSGARVAPPCNPLLGANAGALGEVMPSKAKARSMPSA